MVFPRPVQHRLADVPRAHAALAGQVVAAAGTVRRRAVGVLAVEVPRFGAPQPGIEGIGVVVHHVHDDAQAVLVQRLHGFFQFADAHRAVVGVGGVAAVGDVVVDGVVAPVVGVAALGHRAVVEHRHQLYMGHAQAAQVGNAGRVDAVAVQCGVFQCESLVLAAVRGGHTAGRVEGKILDVRFIDDILRPPGRGGVGGPVFGVCAAQVDDHTARAVAPASHGPRVGGTAGDALGVGDGIVIVHAVEVALGRGAPHPALAADQRQRAQRFAPGAAAVEREHDRPGRRGPQRKGRGLRRPQRAQRGVGMVAARERRRIVKSFCGCCALHGEKPPPFLTKCAGPAVGPTRRWRVQNRFPPAAPGISPSAAGGGQNLNL